MSSTESSKGKPFKRGSPESTTPARPNESSSRQQTHKDQASQTGSPDFDKEATRRTKTPPVPIKPPGAK